MYYFKCKTCNKPIGEREDYGIVVWEKYDKRNYPLNPIIVHKNAFGTHICDPKKLSYSYEISDFFNDYPSFVTCQVQNQRITKEENNG